MVENDVNVVIFVGGLGWRKDVVVSLLNVVVLLDFVICVMVVILFMCNVCCVFKRCLKLRDDID